MFKLKENQESLSGKIFQEETLKRPTTQLNDLLRHSVLDPWGSDCKHPPFALSLAYGTNSRPLHKDLKFCAGTCGTYRTEM